MTNRAKFLAGQRFRTSDAPVDIFYVYDSFIGGIFFGNTSSLNTSNFLSGIGHIDRNSFVTGVLLLNRPAEVTVNFKELIFIDDDK